MLIETCVETEIRVSQVDILTESQNFVVPVFCIRAEYMMTGIFRRMNTRTKIEK